MKTQWAAWMLGATLVVGTLAQASVAAAGPPTGREFSKGKASVRSGGESRRVSNDRNRNDRGNAGRSARGESRGGGSNTPILDALRDASGNRSNKSDYPLLDALRDRARNYDDYRYDRHRDDEMADAYRDAAIANAVVNLVGIAVGAAVHDRTCATPVAVAPAPAPAPVTVVRPQPRGYYTTEQILVSPGHYEDVRVWVPESRDAYGRPVPGYYVVHKRWIPDVYEYRPVWVQE